MDYTKQLERSAAVIVTLFTICIPPQVKGQPLAATEGWPILFLFRLMAGNIMFQGFDLPERNYFSLPNKWTDLTAEMKSWSEHKVVEYVLRHTWGFHEYGQVKRISLDEFENGRKTKDGRMDKGVGLSKPSIISGLKQAIEDGFLRMEVDDQDKGRTKHMYGLKMKEGEVKSLYLGCKESLPGRYKKFTPYIERNLRKTLKDSMSVPDGTDGQCIVPLDGRRGKKTCSKFDLKASSEFHRVVSSHIKVNCRSDNKQWANQFRMMREVDGVSRKDIRAAIEWYGRNIGKEFVIEAFSAATFRKKYANGQIPAAMKRMNGCSSGDLEDSNSNGNGVNDSTICKMHEEVSIRLRELNAWTDWPNPPDRKIIDRVVKELGYDDWRGKYLDVSKLN